MLTRRDIIRSVGLLGGGVLAQGLLSACGGASTSGESGVKAADLAIADIARSAGSTADVPSSVGSVQAFAVALYSQLAAGGANLVSSPYSAAMALAMTVNGARGATLSQMEDVLRIDSLDRYNDGLNALSQALESLSGAVKRADGSSAMISVNIADSLWGQQGEAWKKAFLDVLKRDYGAGMHLVDYKTNAAAATSQINAWTSQQTAGKIPDIIPADLLDAMTRLVLVNAIYLKAPWEEPFQHSATKQGAFTLANGNKTNVAMMSGQMSSASYLNGNGYQAARLLYAGQTLAMTIILPDAPLATFERSLTPDVLTAALATSQPAARLSLTMPKWTFRSQLGLADALSSMGMPAAFSQSADFSGMTTQDKIVVSDVLQQAFIAVDESGTEAAAATAVVMTTTAIAGEPVSMVVDKPFMFAIHDTKTGTPLFLGRVTDPAS